MSLYQALGLVICTQYFPAKSSELIQYNHIIHTAAQTFSLDNVYRYDREFRLHVARHHNRSWGVILQQAWTMFLKDRIGHYSGAKSNNNGTPNTGNQARRRLCFDFNAGNCTFGKRCKFDHRYSFCNKYGHGSFNCRRAKANRSSNQSGVATMSSNTFHQNIFETKDKNHWDKYEKDKGKN